MINPVTENLVKQKQEKAEKILPKLEQLKETLSEYNLFGENQRECIQAQIDIIKCDFKERYIIANYGGVQRKYALKAYQFLNDIYAKEEDILKLWN